jgi:hypothetical protein
MGLRRMTRVARIARQGNVSGFELTLAPSREDSKGYVIESVKEIDRHTALKTLGTSSLTTTLLPGLAKSYLGQDDRDGSREAGAAPRISFVRLAPWQVLSMFDAIRRRDADVRKLYADLEEKNLSLIRDRVRGAVICAYAADGTARGEGLVIELPHKRADGTEAVFNVSIKDDITGGGRAKSGEVQADYAIRRGEQVEAYAVRDGRVSLVQ